MQAHARKSNVSPSAMAQPVSLCSPTDRVRSSPAPRMTMSPSSTSTHWEWSATFKPAVNPTAWPGLSALERSHLLLSRVTQLYRRARGDHGNFRRNFAAAIRRGRKSPPPAVIRGPLLRPNQTSILTYPAASDTVPHRATEPKLLANRRLLL